MTNIFQLIIVIIIPVKLRPLEKKVSDYLHVKVFQIKKIVHMSTFHCHLQST